MSHQNPPSTSFLLFTTPLHLSALRALSTSTSNSNSSTTRKNEPDDTTHLNCPICTEPYHEYTPHADDASADWPVRIDLSATHEGCTRLCGHIIGRRCLQQHLQTKGAWRNKCPLCRCLWFKENHATSGRGSPSGDNNNGGGGGESAGERRTPRLSRWTLMSRLRKSNEAGSASGSGGVDEGKGFVQQILDAFEVSEGSCEVRGSVEEVEKVLERLYRKVDGG